MSTATFAEFAERADYSLLEALTPDPESTADGEDHRPRQVLSGHYVPVTPTPIPEPQYLAHSRSLFSELGLSNDLAQDDQFCRLFSGLWPMNDTRLLSLAAQAPPAGHSTRIVTFWCGVTRR